MKYILSIFVFIFSVPAFSSFACEVNMDRVLVYGNGAINVLHSGRNEYTYICDLKTEWKGVSITTCAMWTSMLQNISKEQNKAIFYYGGKGTCSSLPIYGDSPAPVYIGAIK